MLFREPEKPQPVKTKVRPQIMSRGKKGSKKSWVHTFAPILEEENYDNVIIKNAEEDSKNEEKGPSYLSALKFVSVYNDTVK